MTISIIIATYNAAKTLKRCLDSIVSQLTDETELIIVDGASKDNTNEIIDSYGDKIAVHMSEPDKGIYDAWNKGVTAARGQFVAFIGADDQMLPNTVKHYLNFLKSNGTDFDLVCGKLYFIDDDGKILRKVGEPWNWKKHCRRKLNFAHPGMLHNKRLFERIGYFDLQYSICADSDFLQRIGPSAKGGFIDEYLIRMAQGGMSDGYEAIKEGYLSRKNNKCLSPWINVWAHIELTLRYYIGKTLRYIKVY